jgi:SAM-dependent methyltransferase
LPEFTRTEFTGERVIPDLVETDLFNEHLARYRFAGRFAGKWEKARVLDAGCGAGYGTAELAGAAAVVAMDISGDAITYARSHFARSGVHFLQADCEAMPFASGSFDLVVAFEVIEHLEGWEKLLTEAHRILGTAGILLVSTPNRDYYEESRGTAGPNPFHKHEFTYDEFHSALQVSFPHVCIWTQNHAEAIAFSPVDRSPSGRFGATAEVSGSPDPRHAHFYFAACSRSPIADCDAFAWLPSGANVLRERERHIAKLDGELQKKDAWLRQTIDAHSELQRRHEALTAELERQNRWAGELNGEVHVRDSRIVELQNEQETRLRWIADLENQIVVARAEIDRLEGTVDERTQWAQRLDTEIAGYREELQRIGASKWFRAGAKLGIGPRLRDGQ